ncbi:MAG TPA: putative folate metabolism gamma-glutamate ligase, partial [Candidatus Kaiserbacteria bacterium]|nr:putative folate metabolism gamma-glutamate ligase [Candidatus Kaiserbacteria bacterium]
NSSFAPQNGDIIAVSSKVVSIDEGECVPEEQYDKYELARQEADWYFDAPQNTRWRHCFTIAHGNMAGASGIDESNANGHLILYPKDPFKSARRLRQFFMKNYSLTTVGVIITDSVSVPLRRGAFGIALAWDGFDPLRDYRGKLDLFGRAMQVEVANLADQLAAAAVFSMGECDERMPVVVIRSAKGIVFKNRPASLDTQLFVEPENDLFAPLIWKNRTWKRGGHKKS